MGPKRKAVAKNTSGLKKVKVEVDDVIDKKVKIEVDDVINKMVVRWEWEGDGEKWMQYGNKLNTTLLANEAKTEFKYTVGSKFIMIAQFEKMVQKNKKTGWERRIRLAISESDESADYYTWQWKDDLGKWNNYSAKNSRILEATLKQASSNEVNIDVAVTGATYTVNVTTMKQIIADVKTSKKVTDVQRIKSDAAAADTDDEVDEVKDDAAGDAPATKSSGKSGKAAKSTGKSGRGKSGKVKQEDEDVPTKSTVRTVVMTGKAPVDIECYSMLGKAHVYFESKDVWDCMLNQTNVGNNNNKFYLIQILKEQSKNAYHVWQRWGRVGYSGQNNLVPCGSNLDQAKNIFCKKFKDKTKNDWADRDSFEKCPGKYDLLTMDYSSGKNEKDEVDAPSIKKEDGLSTPDSTLDMRLQNLVNLICDIKSMEEAVIEMKYDAKKAPLGKLTENQIKFGYSALKAIEECINKGKMGSKLTEACSDFYTRIPHNFGMKTPPVIRTKQEVKDKILLLEALSDIEIAIKILKSGDMSENPVDRHYHSLNCGLNALDKGHAEFKLLNEYLQSTHATTHNMYKMELLDVFICNKDGESASFKDHGNRMLLWHGSRLTNWVGILSKGLRIAPPEAPVTGYMFGKGVYFADMSSKSANYCFTSRAKNIGLLLACEVSLGTVNELLAADYRADKLPAGTHSVKGIGKIAPDPKSAKTMADGTLVPIGKGKDTGTTNPSGFSLNYNEFIVYKTSQIKMRYLLKVKFKYT